VEFLNTLYESEYFIYIVGGAIGVLLILFLVILLSGKKKDKVKEEPKIEQELPVMEKSVIADTVPVKDASLDVTKEFKPEDLAALQTKMAEPVKEVVPVMPIVSEEPEEEMIEPIKPAMPVFEEASREEVFVRPNMPIMEETPREDFTPIEPVTPPMDSLITPEPKTTVLNNQFSSVFVDRTSPMEEVKTVNPENLLESTPSEKPVFKVVEDNELPKLNNENKEL
jgi:hypothetical protein